MQPEQEIIQRRNKIISAAAAGLIVGRNCEKVLSKASDDSFVIISILFTSVECSDSNVFFPRSQN